ncbi:MAG TPA: MMPL family transporter [Candidatus Limnocylindrales bacterium]|jgi:RND superfamily putative drug exporter
MAELSERIAQGEPATVRVAMWSSRHRWPVAAGWFVATIGLFGLSLTLGGIRTDNPNGNPNEVQTESAKAYSLFDAGGSATPSEDVTLVVAHPTLHVTDRAYQAFVAHTVSKLKAAALLQGGAAIDAFDEVKDPIVAGPQSGLISRDGSAVRIIGRIDGDQATIDRHLVPVRQAIASIEANSGAFSVHSLSSTLTNQEITDLINSSLDRTFVMIGVTFIILLITFGAFVASIVPLVLAVSSLLAAFGILGLFSQVVSPVSPYATQLIVLIGLAVSVDYSLFMITRFRSERRRNRAKLMAIETASSTAGRAVFFSGLAVMISIAGLLMINVSFFRSMAIGTIGVILVAVIGSLTFLPATLAILGDRINSGRVPYFGRDRAEGIGVWARLVTAVMRRPIRLAVLATVVLLLLGSPVLHLRIGVTDFTSFPDQIDGVQAVKLINQKWPEGSTLNLQVVVTGYDRADTKAAVEGLKATGLKVAGLSGPATVATSRDATVALVSFTMAGTQNDLASQAIVREFRSTVVPATFGRLSGVQAYVAGQAARALDVTQIYLDAIPLVFGFVLGLSFLLLLIVFHSLVIPIKAILLNLLSTAAAFGVMVAVFQDGIVGHAFGLAQSSVIESWVPIFVFAILFGLSMDYHVFILTRVKEARDRGLDSQAAVAKGISITSGTITSAATIMVLVFAAFVTIPFAFIQELGLGLAVAILLDATIVRSVLLPATMSLLGDWNWWLPPFLRWLPRVTIEGEPEADLQSEPVPAT